MCALLAAAEQTPKLTLDTSETLFSVLTAINACGYNQDLATSLPLRQQLRGEVANAVRASADATQVQQQLCLFYNDHGQADSGRELAQYISLALNLGPPPDFALGVKEADLPPDAQYVLGFVPLLKRYHQIAALHRVWEKHQPDYEALLQRFHDPVSSMITRTDVYLRLPISGYLGRRFVIYIEPMAAPGQPNARNYGSDYYVVTSPDNGPLRLDQIRHTYLHYVLDPLAAKHAYSMKRLDALLKTVYDSPMEESYKRDTSLLVTESMIRAIEARTLAKASDEQKRQALDASMREGFVLTQYFFNALQQFETGPAGMQDAYGDLLYNIDVGREQKNARNVQFGRQAAPELVKASKAKPGQLLNRAEDRLAAGDPKNAQQLAQEALDRRVEDPARALFILARSATLNRDMSGARTYFERTLEVAHEPRLVAWSHIYLGRICDLQENRDAALLHYRAALAAGDPAPETKAAAERGLQQPYQPPAQHRQEQGGGEENRPEQTPAEPQK